MLTARVLVVLGEGDCCFISYIRLAFLLSARMIADLILVELEQLMAWLHQALHKEYCAEKTPRKQNFVIVVLGDPSEPSRARWEMLRPIYRQAFVSAQRSQARPQSLIVPSDVNAHG